MTSENRVLHVIPSIATRSGGPSKSVAMLAHYCTELGVESWIYSTDADGPHSDIRGKLDPKDIPMEKLLNYRLFPQQHPFRLAFSLPMIRSLVRDSRSFDIVHIHSLFLFPQFAAWLGAERSRRPFVVSPRGALNPVLRGGGVRKTLTGMAWQNRMLQRAAAIHVTSELEAADLRRFGFGPDLVEIPNIADIDPVSMVARGRAEDPPDTFVIGYHGRIAPMKGIDVLVRSFAIVRNQLPSARLKIVGTGDAAYVTSLRSLAESLGVSSSIEWTGELRSEELYREVAGFSVWCIPSIGENFGNALTEAMACGVPCIASPHVGAAEKARSQHALLVAERTPEAFAASIIRINSSPSLAASLSRAGLEFSSELGWRRIVPQYIELYERLSTEHRS